MKIKPFFLPLIAMLLFFSCTKKLDDLPVENLDKKTEETKSEQSKKQLLRSGDIATRIYKLILEGGTGVTLEEIVPAASFVDDFGWDDLDVIEFFMAVEEEFGIEISDEDMETITTISEILDYVEEHYDGGGDGPPTNPGEPEIPQIPEFPGGTPESPMLYYYSDYDFNDSDVDINGVPRFQISSSVGIYKSNASKKVYAIRSPYSWMYPSSLTYTASNGDLIHRTASVQDLHFSFSPALPANEIDLTWSFYVKYEKSVNGGPLQISQSPYKTITKHYGPY